MHIELIWEKDIRNSDVLIYINDENIKEEYRIVEDDSQDLIIPDGMGRIIINWDIDFPKGKIVVWWYTFPTFTGVVNVDALKANNFATCYSSDENSIISKNTKTLQENIAESWMVHYEYTDNTLVFNSNLTVRELDVEKIDCLSNLTFEKAGVYFWLDVKWHTVWNELIYTTRSDDMVTQETYTNFNTADIWSIISWKIISLSLIRDIRFNKLNVKSIVCPEDWFYLIGWDWIYKKDEFYKKWIIQYLWEYWEVLNNPNKISCNDGIDECIDYEQGWHSSILGFLNKKLFKSTEETKRISKECIDNKSLHPMLAFADWVEEWYWDILEEVDTLNKKVLEKRINEIKMELESTSNPEEKNIEIMYNQWMLKAFTETLEWINGIDNIESISNKSNKNTKVEWSLQWENNSIWEFLKKRYTETHDAFFKEEKLIPMDADIPDNLVIMDWTQTAYSIMMRSSKTWNETIDKKFIEKNIKRLNLEEKKAKSRDDDYEWWYSLAISGQLKAFKEVLEFLNKLDNIDSIPNKNKKTKIDKSVKFK